MNRLNNNSKPISDPKVLSHLLGVGLDCTDGHKRITQADKFSILGGSENTHDSMTETLCKTFEDLSRKGKSLEDASMEELSDLIRKNTPKT
ncbi:MAG: hypothetical protein VX609_05405 [Verrucomicrobiota bacterium]|nr:hypothetical protein [Verrucomicrobiota bacterium]